MNEARGPGRRVLYLTYDGLTDPLGQSQVLPYLRSLAACGHEITVISCEKREGRAARGEAIADECRDAGIMWYPLRYRKRPPIISTLIDLAHMRQLAICLVQKQTYDIVHCRSYLTALIGRSLQRHHAMSFLFDMRGFWIDERFERGIWRRGHVIYEAIATWFRKKEKDFLSNADAIVSLTHGARGELQRRGGASWAEKTFVIPCCVDLAHFDPRNGAARAEGRSLIGTKDDIPVLLYLGSLGGAYPLAPVFRFFKTWSEGRDNARLLFISRHPESEIRSHPDAIDLGNRLIIRAGERANVPALIAAADAGLSFILPSFCATASSPTKVGEMLAMGLPVAANDKVGDMALVMAEPGAGLLLCDLSDTSVDGAACAMRSLRQEVGSARAVASRWFALERGVDSYDSIYRTMMRR